MSALSPAHLLETWASARDKAAPERALVLANTRADRPAELAIGDRDRLLFDAYSANFGAAIEVLADCRTCGATFELTLDAAMLAGTEPDAAHLSVLLGPDAVALRLPTTTDVLSSLLSDAPARSLALLCLPAERRNAALSDGDVARIGTALVAAEPLLDPQVAVDCPECGARQAHGIDIVTLLWERIEAAARAIMRQVDLLARTYGWSEHDILALPSARRSAYIAMAAA